MHITFLHHLFTAVDTSRSENLSELPCPFIINSPTFSFIYESWPDPPFLRSHTATLSHDPIEQWAPIATLWLPPSCIAKTRINNVPSNNEREPAEEVILLYGWFFSAIFRQVVSWVFSLASRSYSEILLKVFSCAMKYRITNDMRRYRRSPASYDAVWSFIY